MTLAPPAPHRETPAPRWRRVAGHPLTHLVAALLVIALLQAFVVKLYQVPSASMDPTLTPGDRILVDRVSTAVGDPRPGDVVVFERPDSWREGPEPERPLWRTILGGAGDVLGFGFSNGDALVKRIVAGPGQSVRCCDADGRLLVDGAPLAEPYVVDDHPFVAGSVDCASTPRSLRCFDEVTLGDDEYLLLGDNRAASSDGISPCRTTAAVSPEGCARLVTEAEIVGIAFFRLWPLTAVGGF